MVLAPFVGIRTLRKRVAKAMAQIYWQSRYTGKVDEITLARFRPVSPVKSNVTWVRINTIIMLMDALSRPQR